MNPAQTKTLYGAISLIVIAVAIGVYDYTVKPRPAPVVIDFTGTITAKEGDTITVARLVPPTDKNVPSTVPETVVIIGNTKLAFLAINPEVAVFTKKIDPLRRQGALALLSTSTSQTVPVPPFFIETPMTAEQLAVGSTAAVTAEKRANIITALQIKVFPDSFVLDPFSNPPVSAVNK